MAPIRIDFCITMSGWMTDLFHFPHLLRKKTWNVTFPDVMCRTGVISIMDLHSEHHLWLNKDMPGKFVCLGGKKHGIKPPIQTNLHGLAKSLHCRISPCGWCNFINAKALRWLYLLEWVHTFITPQVSDVMGVIVLALSVCPSVSLWGLNEQTR